MRTAIRKAGVACGALLASTALTVSTANGAWASSSALVVGGLETSTLHDVVMSQLLGGALQGQQRVSVNWPAEHKPSNGLSLGESIAVGVDNLDAELDAALSRLSGPGEQVTVVGLSAGSLVVNEVLRDLVNDANAPGKDQVTFVVVADSSRQDVIDKAKYNSQYDYTYQPAPEVKYDVSVVVAEFDGTHDFPDRWWHFTAVINSIAGAIVGHLPVMFADLSEVPVTNIEVDVNSKGGTTTTYLVPAEELPLVKLFPFLKSSEASLRRAVERGYSRYDNKPSAVQAAALAAPAVAEDVDDSPAAETKVAAPAAEPVESAPVDESNGTDEDDAEAGNDTANDTANETASVNEDDAEFAEAETTETAEATEAAEAEAVEAEAVEAEAVEAEAAAAEAEAAEAEALEAEAAEAEAAEAEAAEAEAAEAEAAEAEAADDTDAADVGAADDAPSSDSGSADSSDSE
ncbi:MAG: PE-PPE domain-containing protein [Actinomycetia bacterium]|nr:PE-PPE domain-containing protein [Actinomycetes bacterium]MCH9761516.1 PE-PPE domain-containing protein [Actinomycetes bacterium]